MLKNRKKPMKKAVLHIFMGLCVIFLTTSAGGGCRFGACQIKSGTDYVTHLWSHVVLGCTPPRLI